MMSDKNKGIKKVKKNEGSGENQVLWSMVGLGLTD